MVIPFGPGDDGRLVRRLIAVSAPVAPDDGRGERRHLKDDDNGEVGHRLTVELVPSTCWYINLRSNASKAVWGRLRRRVAAEAGQRCEICGGRGRRWPVECHDVWHYDDSTKVQRLEGWWRCFPLPRGEARRFRLRSGSFDAVVKHLADATD
jgi:hypothetical protein